MLSNFGECFNSSKSTLYIDLAPSTNPREGAWYLSNLPSNYANVLTKFRMRNTYIRWETGGWTQTPIPYGQRTCPFCGPQAIEDEYHHIFICPDYSDIRDDIFASYAGANHLACTADLLSSVDRRVQYRLARFLRVSGKRRRELYTADNL